MKALHFWGSFTARKAPRGPDWSVLQHRDFRWLWTAGGVSNACRWMEMAVVGWLVLEMTDSPWHVAVAGVCRSAPMLAFGLFAGLIADRTNRWRVLLLAQMSYALVTLALLALLAMQAMQPWHIFVGAVILGCSTIAELPSRRSLLSDLVGSQHLVSAMSLETVNNTVGKFLGPLVGGLIIEVAGFPGAYLVLLGASVSALLCITQVKTNLPTPITRTLPIWQSLAGGIRYALHNRVILGVLGTTIVMNALAFSYVQLLPVVARDHLQVGPGWMGLLAAADGIGTLVGALLIAAMGNVRQPGRLFVLGAQLELISLVAFALSPWYGLSFALLLAVGVGNAGFSTMQSTIILLAAAPGMRGRALGLMGLCIGATPLGLLELGAVAAVLPTQVAIGINAGAALALLIPVMVLTPLLTGPVTPSVEESMP